MKSAFPTLERGGGGLDLTDPGMTLRDWFAAHAPPRPDNESNWFLERCRTKGYTGDADMDALWRFEHADAMLRARGDS